MMPSGRDLRMPWPSDQARPGSQPHRYLWSQRGDPWQSESMHSLEAAIVQRSTKLAPRIMAIDKQRHRLTHYYSGPICARAFKIWILRDLSSRGHHDWPVMPTTRPEGDQRELLSAAKLISGFFLSLHTFVCERARLGNYAVNPDASEITPTPPHDILGSCTRLRL